MPDKAKVARELIEWHFRVEPGLREVYWIQADEEATGNGPIKLLEVNEATVETGEVMPFAFRATSEIPFPSVIAEITPEELERIRKREISLPRGWDLERAQIFVRPAAS